MPATLFLDNLLGMVLVMAEALVFMPLSLLLHRFRAGYAFDLTCSPLRNFNAGSHALMTSIDLGRGAPNLMTPQNP
ncbi:MAG: hypothetical protein RLZZ165_707 [Bacteroidota bacterium]